MSDSIPTTTSVKDAQFKTSANTSRPLLTIQVYNYDTQQTVDMSEAPKNPDLISWVVQVSGMRNLYSNCSVRFTISLPRSLIEALPMDVLAEEFRDALKNMAEYAQTRS